MGGRAVGAAQDGIDKHSPYPPLSGVVSQPKGTGFDLAVSFLEKDPIPYLLLNDMDLTALCTLDQLNN